MDAKLLINEKIGEVSIKINEPQYSEYILVLTHGAGAGMKHSFLERLAVRFSTLGAIIVRFNFPYKEAGKKLPGSPKPNLISIGKVVSWIQDQYQNLPLFLSGKSYGGRISSHWINENPQNNVKGLIYFGFPLHAPGKPSKDRAAHLYSIKIPQFFIQGTRDALASFDLMQEVIQEIPTAECYNVEQADHSFKVPKKYKNLTESEVFMEMTDTTNNWIRCQIE